MSRSAVAAGLMSAESHQRIKEIFLAACLEPPSERVAFLARVCGADQDTRREVESLLAFHEEPAEKKRRNRPDREAKMRLRRGHVLAGRYRIERLLGVGGMGEVYAVYDALLHQEVALKILRHAGTEHQRRLVQEVRLARQVTHRGVCRVYDIGEDAGTAFLTMELVDGEDMAMKLARSGPLSSAAVRHIALHLSEALAAAHEAGVLHRDLKPSNILVARSGWLSITDFGIATSRTRTLAARDSGSQDFGTPAYLAPEMTEIGAVPTERTDLYSLGVVLYELVTGALPFEASDVETLLTLHQRATPEPPSRLVAGVDVDLESLVLRMLSKDPAARPESARAVIEALSREAPSPIETTAVPAQSERRELVALVCELEAPPTVMDARDWPELVRIFQTRCTALCRLGGGRVARHLDRGLLIHFGLPFPSEQDAERAVQAGLDIVAEMRERPLADVERGRFVTTVVVDATYAVVRAGRSTGSGRRPEGVPDGRPEDHESPTGSDAVLVSAEILPRVREAFVTEPARKDAASLDRSRGARVLHRITGARQRLGLEAGTRRLTHLVGRELELASLERWWQDAASGRGQIVLLSGEVGLGKSRLVHELWQRISRDGIGLEGRCSSHHRHTPLLPFIGMVALAAGLDASDGHEERTAKLRHTLAVLGDRAQELLAVFSAWLPGSAGSTPATGASSEADRSAFIAAIQEWILALAERSPVLVVCEDLHWSDPTTREAVGLLIDGFRLAPVLLVLTSRPELSPPWMGSGIHPLALQPLRDEEARAMVAAMPGLAGRDDDAILDRADGNPLFLEELVKHADEARAPAAAAAVPQSLRGLLAARLDRLGAAKRVAQAAAVCGHDFRHPLLAVVAGHAVGDELLGAAIARLLDAEILFRRGAPPRASFSFTHSLLREAAYDSLPARERRRLHELAAAALPDLDPEVVASRPELVARHWSEAGRPDQAYGWWQQAGRRSLEYSAYAEAIHHLEQALRTLPRAVPPAGRRRERLQLLLALTAAETGRTGPVSEASVSYVFRAQALCAGLEVDDDVGLALFLSARATFVRGNRRAKMRAAKRLTPLAVLIQDPYLRSAILGGEANQLAYLGRLEEAEPLFTRAIESYDQVEPRRASTLATDPRVHLQFTRALVEWLRGRCASSRRCLDDGLDLADRLDHPLSQALMRLYWATLALLEGDRPLAAKLLSEGRRLAASHDVAWLVHYASFFEPLADPAITPQALIERLQAAWDVEWGVPNFRSLAAAELADLLANAGRRTESEHWMDEAVTLASHHFDGFLLPEILRRRGELLARLGRAAEAEPTLRRSLGAARRQGAFRLELRSALSLSRLLAAGGHNAAARSVLARTLARLPDDVDAPERAEAASRLDAGAAPTAERR